MRNLKRALSMAMASVMLMGMSVVGTSAASVNDFSDVDAINNQEAVAIATGLGIFDGYDDGEFKPERVVTRAEMAVVIAKILHGSDVDPTNFVGASKFTDVPAWAEGYVNLVASLGIIEGYGDGKFGPNDTVTTAQASTMLLKALGYYISEGDALGKDWDLQATSKATALGFYGDLSLKMNEGLTREDVAELTFNALFAQRVAFDDVRGLHVKANDRNVVVTNGTDDEANTLAQNTYGLYSVEGLIVANGMTNESLSESLKSKAQTRVLFEENIDLNKDGKVDIDAEETYDFEVATGLDMIGHAAKVYYKIEKKAPVVFAVVDQATLVAEIEYANNTTTLAGRANDAGFKKNTVLDVKTNDYILNYNMEDVDKNGAMKEGLDKLILISNDASLSVDYVIAVDQYLDVVADYDEDEDEYKLENDNATKMNLATADFAEGDLVIVTDIGNQDKVKIMEPVVLADGNLTKIAGKSQAGGGTVTKITVDGENYTESMVYVDPGFSYDKFTAFADIETIGDVTMIMDYNGEVIGLAKEATPDNYAYVAQYGVRHGTGALNTGDVYTAHIYFADGTDGIYEIDTKNSDFHTKGTWAAFKVTWTDLDSDSDVDEDDYKLLMNGSNANALATANGGMKGLYDVSINSDGKAEIDVIANVAGETNITASAAANGVSVVPGMATLVKADGTYVVDHAYTQLSNNDTVYFYVTGKYDDEDLRVNVVTGNKNVVKHTNDTSAKDETITGDPTIGTGIRQAFSTDVKGGQLHQKRSRIDVMLIQGVTVEGTDVYYYNKNYYVTETEDGFTVTFTIWSNETGEEFEVTYDNSGKYFATEAQAKAFANENNNGFYTIGSKKLNRYDDVAGASGKSSKLDNCYYIVNDTADYDDWNDNLHTTLNQTGSITGATKVIDICDSGLTSISKIAKAIDDDGDVTLSFSYDKNYETAIIFVTSYDPDKTEAPNNSTNNYNIKKVELADDAIKVTLYNAYDTSETVKMDVELYLLDNKGDWNLVSEKEVSFNFAASVDNATDSSFGYDEMLAGERYFVVVDGVSSNTDLHK